MYNHAIEYEPTREEQSHAYAKVTARIIPFLFLCYVAAYLDRVNVGFAKLQMMSDLGLSDAAYGLGAGVFFIGYLLCEVPSNLIMMKVGARRWIARIMITWALVSAAMMLVKSPTSFYITRFLLGVAEAGFFPAVALYLTYWFPPSRCAKATALFMTAIPMSGVFGGPLSGYILHSMGNLGGLAAWQWLFLIEALPSLILGVAAFFFLDDRVEDAKWLTAQERAILATNLKSEQHHRHLNSLREGFANKKIWLLSIMFLFFTMGLYGISFWLPTIIKQTGVADPLNVGLLTALPYGAAAISMVMVSRSSDARRERRWHVAIPGLIGSLGLLVSALNSHDTTISLVALTFGTAGVLTTISQFWVLPPSFMGGAAVAAGFAVANTIGSVSGLVAPYLIGLVQGFSHSTTGGVFALAACGVLGSVMVFMIDSKSVNH